MSNLFFKVLYFSIILFLIYQNHKLNQTIHKLEDTMILQDRAIQMQNVLINFYKKNPNFMERNDGFYYNPLHQKENNQPI